MASLPITKPIENFVQWHGLATLALRDRLQKHLFRFWISLERFVSFGKQHGDCGAFGKIHVELDMTINDAARSNPHTIILPRDSGPFHLIDFRYSRESDTMLFRDANESI